MGCPELTIYDYFRIGTENRLKGGSHDRFVDANKNIMGYIDASDGTSVADYEYSPFGKLIVSTGTMADDFAFKFSSYYTDNETDLVYYGYRYYDADMGRWLNRDPIGEVNIELTTEQIDFNLLYGFVSNNAINSWDLLGLWKYEFITKKSTNEAFGEKLKKKVTYGHILAMTEGTEDSLEDLAKHWAFGDSSNLAMIKFIPTESIPKKPKSGKEGCIYDVFPIMPKFYQDTVGKTSGGNCGYAAMAYLGFYEAKIGGTDDIRETYKFLIEKMQGISSFDKPGDLILWRKRGKLYPASFVHFAIYLEKDSTGKSWVFQKDRGITKYEIIERAKVKYNSTNKHWGYRKK